MKTSIIYHSYSGNTRSVAAAVHAACGGKLIEITSKEYSSRLSAYTIGCYRAMKKTYNDILREPPRRSG